MASAADVRSALSLPPPPAAGPSSQPAPNKKGKAKERDPRALAALIGPTPPGALLSRRRTASAPSAPAAKWEYRRFKNAARTDGLVLGHWARASEDPAAEYKWAALNVRGPAHAYSDDEYARLLADPEWSRAETDYLFRVVDEWDARWALVADRYAFPGGPERSMEDLKDRYFSACRRVLRQRPNPDPALLASLEFDKEREVMRKKYLLSLDARTPAERAEEDALYIELRRLEQRERSFRAQRDGLMRVLLGVEAGLPGLPFAADGGPFASAAPPRPNKRRHAETESPGASTPATAGGAGGSVSTRRTAPAPPPAAQSPASAEYDARHCIHRPDPRSIVPTKSAHNIAFLRSGKMAAPKTAMYARVVALLAELGVSQTRLVMPTRENLVAYEGVVDACAGVVDAKKAIDRVEGELRALRGRAGVREGGEEGGGEEGEGGEGEDEDAAGSSVGVGRRASVARSARSVSVSSVDTAARGGPQQKKRRIG